MALNRKELNLFDTIVNCLISIENSNLYIKNRVNIMNYHQNAAKLYIQVHIQILYHWHTCCTKIKEKLL